MLKNKRYFKYTVLAILAFPLIIMAEKTYKTVINKEVMSYVDSQKVSFNVAKYRLGIQQEIGKLNGFLTNNYKQSFSGLYIQHQPTYSINLLFKKSEDTKIPDSLWTKKSWSQFIKVRYVDFSRKELVSAQKKLNELISKLNTQNTVFFNIIKNHVELHVLKEHSFEKSLLVHGLKLPKEVVIVVVKEFHPIKSTDESK